MASSRMRREEGRPVSKSFDRQEAWVCIPQAGRREVEAVKLERTEPQRLAQGGLPSAPSRSS